MGAGIAQVCAQAEYDTVVREVSDALCEKALASIESSFDKAIAKDKATAEDKAAALSRLRFVTSMIDLRDRDLIIEAVVEDRDVKRASFGKLDCAVSAAYDLRVQYVQPDDH